MNVKHKLKKKIILLILVTAGAVAFAQDTLRDAAAKYNLLIGTALGRGQLNNPRFKAATEQNFSSMTPENDLKMPAVARIQDSYNFNSVDVLVQWAEANKIKVRGHTLIWHKAVPAWILKTGWSKDQVLQFLKDYINTVVTHFKDKIYAWDVVNEPIEDDGRLRDDSSFWQKTCGIEYIEKAFTWAHEADPNAKLFINDYNIEEMNNKANALYALVKSLLAKGVPVHGVGFQCHVIEETPPNFGALLQNVKRFADLGLEVQFTELDVRIGGEVTKDKLAHQADIYRDFFRVALANKKVTGVTTWGTSDNDSWINYTNKGYGSALLFDAQYAPKPAFQAVLAALKAGPEKNLTFTLPTTNRKLLAPFKALAADKAPTIDGVVDKGEWDKAIVYPFPFNQLSARNQTPPDRADLAADWRILYQGNTIYGMVNRADEKTVTNEKNDYDNDNIEVFFGIDSDYVQLRTLVGEDFKDNYYKGKRKAVWNKEGTVLEFQVELPPAALAGRIIGWNIALSDNDGSGGRDCQLYPVAGNNTGWQGEGFGEIEFSARTGKSVRIGRPHPAPAFTATAVSPVPVIDGEAFSGEWTAGVAYPLPYNQLNSADQTAPQGPDLYSDWRIIYNGTTIYGMLKRSGDKASADVPLTLSGDAVDIFIEVDGKFAQLRTAVGRDFDKSALAGKRQAVWSKKGDVLEFFIDLPTADVKNKIIGWNIAVTHNAEKSKRLYQLYPVSGSGLSAKGQELGELAFR
jgi:endo-1,4-beta-xylanase